MNKKENIENTDIKNNKKVIWWFAIPSILICASILFCAYSFYSSIKETHAQAFKNINHTIENLKIEQKIKNKNSSYHVVFDKEIAKENISKIENMEYEKFMANYYQIQNHWLNIWLFALGIIIAVIGVASPFFFAKLFERKEKEIDLSISIAKDKIKEMDRIIEQSKKNAKEMKDEIDKSIATSKSKVTEIDIAIAESILKKTEIDNYINTSKNKTEELENLIKEANENCKTIRTTAKEVEDNANKSKEAAIEAKKSEEISKIYNQIHKLFTEAYSSENMNIGIKKYLEVIELFETLETDYGVEIKKNELYYNAYNNLGINYGNLGNYEKTIEMLLKAIQSNPNDYNAYSNLGTTYNRIKQYKKAMDVLEKAIELEPNDSNTYNNLGLVYYNTIKYEASIKEFKKAITLDKNYKYPHHFRNIVLAYIASENFDEAVKAADLYLEKFDYTSKANLDEFEILKDKYPKNKIVQDIYSKFSKLEIKD